ncbi:ATP phosphoribosyltransferase [Tenacibaculum gallaicum]|uniref:ATP phosphoribosyltransferase n=2 Tax=Tenacibaculum gallaicum TaxID=561505 RepID=A0A3E0HM74_9FLAO|nr:ATP phosphoribosyltransferase [Tenacibaculum gallaicum]
MSKSNGFFISKAPGKNLLKTIYSNPFKTKMSKLKIAIQKSGRLNQESLQILKDCGISIDNGKDQLKASANNFPLEVFYLRNGDIPQYLKDGVVDAAIIGENLLIEKGEEIQFIEKLGFSKCKVSLAVPKNEEYTRINYFQNKKIATSYPNTVLKYLQKNNIQAQLHIINGSVEIAPNIGLADGICDIVSSGSTLFKNNLKEVEVLLKSEAVLAVSPQIKEQQQVILNKLQFRIQSVLKARQSRYVLLNAPNEKLESIINILPGMRSPTVLPLAEEGWSSVHSVLNKNQFWEIIDELKSNGAEGILVCPIEKMVI